MDIYGDLEFVDGEIQNVTIDIFTEEPTPEENIEEPQEDS